MYSICRVKFILSTLWHQVVSNTLHNKSILEKAKIKHTQGVLIWTTDMKHGARENDIACYKDLEPELSHRQCNMPLNHLVTRMPKFIICYKKKSWNVSHLWPQSKKKGKLCSNCYQLSSKCLQLGVLVMWCIDYVAWISKIVLLLWLPVV